MLCTIFSSFVALVTEWGKQSVLVSTETGQTKIVHARSLVDVRTKRRHLQTKNSLSNATEVMLAMCARHLRSENHEMPKYLCR